jgi:hypothetical protein
VDGGIIGVNNKAGGEISRGGWFCSEVLILTQNCICSMSNEFRKSEDRVGREAGKE